MELIPTDVQCHAGYKADETPRRFFWTDQWLDVSEVVDRWHQGDRDPEWPTADYFKVIDGDGREFLLKHDLESDDWYLWTSP